jgi:hypothetical protein
MVDGLSQKCSWEGEFTGFLKIYLKFLFRVEKLSGWANFLLGKSRRRDSRRNRAARFIHKAIFDSEI